jgi:hypothetical protein
MTADPYARSGRRRALGAKLVDGPIAAELGDRPTVAALTAYAGLAAEKPGDLDAAAGYWRRAIAAGSTDQTVADRFSVWLTKRHEYQEAAQVLRQARMANSDSAQVAERMRRRLARCERDLAEYHSRDRVLTASRNPRTRRGIC